MHLIDRGVVQIVRRFGPVGGMESYAYHLSQELARRGHKVFVLCESVEATSDQIDPSINLVTLEKSAAKRRWRAMLDFRSAVDGFFQRYPSEALKVVHSHERTAWHHVTTFHGPPMTTRLKWYQFSSRRRRAWNQLEFEELVGNRVRVIVPVSSFVEQILKEKYSNALNAAIVPVLPGVERAMSRLFSECSEGIRAVFVGKEWKRKGLEKVFHVVQLLRASNIEISLDIYGPEASELPFRIRSSRYVCCKGWVSPIPYQDYDVIVHPARSEPYGMCIAEALNEGCRALVSEHCGVIDLNHPGCWCISLTESDLLWANQVRSLCSISPMQQPIRTWQNVAFEYEESVYNRVF